MPLATTPAWGAPPRRWIVRARQGDHAGMWRRERTAASPRAGKSVPEAKEASSGVSGVEPTGRRAYYRVEALLPIRLTRIAPEDVDAAIFDLSLPDPLLQPIEEMEGDAALQERLRRIEEKLDLLLGASPVDVPRRLSGRDRRHVVFSGAGLALDVDFVARRGEAFKLEILLPPPYGRTLRAVARVVTGTGTGGAGRRLALALDHMEDEERDALVAYSYDLQRFALRTRDAGGRRGTVAT